MRLPAESEDPLLGLQGLGFSAVQSGLPMVLGVQALCFPLRHRETTHTANGSQVLQALVKGRWLQAIASTPAAAHRRWNRHPSVHPSLDCYVKSVAGDRKQASAVFVSARPTEGRLCPRGHGHVGREASRNCSLSPGQTCSKVP